MRTILLGAIVVAVIAGCGGGGGDHHADICEPCTGAVDHCRFDCECVRVVDRECFGPETDEEREDVRVCMADCRTCDAGLDCSFFRFDVPRCLINDSRSQCCDGDRMVPCD